MNNDKKTTEELKYSLSKELVLQLLYRLAVFVVIMVIVCFIAYKLCQTRVWQWYDPFYPLIHFLHENLIAIMLVLLLFGLFILTVFYIWKMMGYLEEVVKAVDMIAKGEEIALSLPKELYQIEQTLNQIAIETNKSKAEAREANQRKNDLIVYMAHDLKTPLTSVIGYLTLLTENQEIPEELKLKYEKIALKKAERLEELTNEFFEITRLNLSEITLSLSTVNMSMMLSQITYEFLPLFAEKNLTYRLLLDKDIMVTCDVEKMERVFDNLLKNAINYCYEDSEIVITAKKEETGEIHISFMNHGRTIPKEKLERLFEQFFRLESSRSSGSGGSGLGLAIAREIIRKHGGELTCESENEQIQFVISLPQ